MLPVAATVAQECYRRVGAGWHWLDRVDWDVAQWTAALATPGTELWTARAGEMLIGFFLLVRHDTDTEIKLFGLVPEWIGRRVGGWLLTEAIRRAWATGGTRVMLNTCSLDGPAALPNYLARGFTVEREEHQLRNLSE
jgi:GNAT superfamily N-acetyltransferase